MGNKCSTKTANPLFDDTNLNDYDRAIFNLKREKVFYGTIAICVLYGSFALILFILSLISEKIKYLLLNSFLPFTIVYIIGTILIIMYLIHQVLNFKPYKLSKDGNYDNISCPDYWSLEFIGGDDNTSNGMYKAFENTVVVNTLFNSRCVLNSDIFDSYDIFKASSNSTAGKYTGQYHFFNIASNIQNTINIHDSNYNILPNKRVKINSDNSLYPNILYANIYNNYHNSGTENISNIVNTKIFKKKEELELNYQIARASLLMNNYKILNPTTPTKYGMDTAEDYTDFYRDFTTQDLYDNEATYKALLNSIGVSFLNFNYRIDSSTDISAANNSNIFNKVIRLFKNGNAIACERPIITSGRGSISDPLCTTTKSAVTGTENNYIKSLPLNCEAVYPEFLASMDKKINEVDRNMDTNVLRCAYSKICGIPWSDLNCDKYDD